MPVSACTAPVACECACVLKNEVFKSSCASAVIGTLIAIPLADAPPVIGPVRVATRSSVHCATVQFTGSSLMLASCVFVVSLSVPRIVSMGTTSVAVSSETGSGGGAGGGVRLGGGASNP